MRAGWEMSYHPRRILPPGETRKRKERESLYSAAPSTITKTTTPRAFVRPAPAPAPAQAQAQAAGKVKPAEEKSDNRLLAGYMAHEFLTKGTLFGQRFDPVRPEAVSVSGRPAEPRRAKPEAEPSGGAKKVAAEEEGRASYADVAGILKSDGAHIPGIVNPTQLARWIHQT